MSSPLVEPFRRALGDSTGTAHAAGGRKVLGYFCTYTPVELIHAAGFLPLRITGGIDRVSKADSLTPNFICPFMRLAMERALEGDYAHLSGIVQGYTCDVACGLVNIWEENLGGDIFHSLPLPYNRSESARQFFRASLMELLDRLESIGGSFSMERLEGSLALYGKIRRIVLDLYGQRYEQSFPLPAADFLTLIQAGFLIPPEDYLVLLEDLKKRCDPGEYPPREGVPVLVSGSLIEEPRVLRVLEESGGRVVSDDLCTGFRHFYPAAGEGHTPLDQVVDRYLNRFPCPSRSRARERVPLLLDLIARSGARGVVFLLQKFCSPHLADVPVLVEELKKKGIPSTLFEMEETGIMEGQLRTRMETFFGILGE